MPELGNMLLRPCDADHVAGVDRWNRLYRVAAQLAVRAWLEQRSEGTGAGAGGAGIADTNRRSSSSLSRSAT